MAHLAVFFDVFVRLFVVITGYDFRYKFETEFPFTGQYALLQEN